MKILAVIDMQNDFIDGALGTEEAVGIVPNVERKIREYRKTGNPVVFTRDSHPENYMETQEGRNLPVPHCIKETEGWEIAQIFDTEGCLIFDKPCFGSYALVDWLMQQDPVPDGIEIVGICTDICVISNAMMIKSALPEVPVSVDASCCAGVTPESHDNALKAMEACQIEITGR